jgi:hypothetical protein
MSEPPDRGDAFEKADPSRRQFLKYLAAAPFVAPVLLSATEAKAAGAVPITNQPTPTPCPTRKPRPTETPCPTRTQDPTPTPTPCPTKTLAPDPTWPLTSSWKPKTLRWPWRR